MKFYDASVGDQFESYCADPLVTPSWAPDHFHTGQPDRQLILDPRSVRVLVDPFSLFLPYIQDI